MKVKLKKCKKTAGISPSQTRHFYGNASTPYCPHACRTGSTVTRT